MKKFVRIINTLIITAACALFLPACYDMFDFQAPKKTEDRKGTFQLVIGSEGASRTILPTTVQTDFTGYTLAFTVTSAGEGTAKNVDWTSTSGTVTLDAGEYDLKVTAKIDSDEVATGTLAAPITITAGQTTNGGTVTLKPVITGTGKGKFSWDITIVPTVTSATMTITPVGGGTAVTIDLAANGADTEELDIGYYHVLFELTNASKTVKMEEYLHIYKNLTSTYPAFTFTADHFNVPVNSVSLNKSSLALTYGGVGGPASETLTATVSADVPENTPTNRNVTWQSSDTAVATVTNGLVTAVAGGTATITVTTAEGGKTDTCSVTVTEPVTSITVSPTTLTFTMGGTLTDTLTATVGRNTATNKAVTWSSTNTAVATVSNGTVTAVAAGTATITATADDGSGVTGTCAVTVNAAVTGATIDITFADFADEAPPISVTTPLSKTATGGNPTTVPLTATGFTSASWSVDNIEKEPSNFNFELKAGDYSLGTHFITLKVIKNGAPYNTTISFTVVP